MFLFSARSSTSKNRPIPYLSFLFVENVCNFTSHRKKCLAVLCQCLRLLFSWGIIEHVFESVMWFHLEYSSHDYGVKPEIVDMSIWLIWPNHLQGNLHWKLHILGVPWVAYIDYILSFVAITVGHFLTSKCKLPSYLIHMLCDFLETLGVKWVVERGILKKEYYVHIIDWV